MPRASQRQTAPALRWNRRFGQLRRSGAPCLGRTGWRMTTLTRLEVVLAIGGVLEVDLDRGSVVADACLAGRLRGGSRRTGVKPILPTGGDCSSSPR